MVAGFLRYNLRYRPSRRPLKPRAMCLYVTYRCNFRCRICGIWDIDPSTLGPEWTVHELAAYLDDPFFTELQFVNLNGGEPTLRSDLVQIAEVLLERLGKLRNLTLNTNGTPSARCLDQCRRILEACRRRRVRFGVSVSLHGVGETHDRIVGVPGAFERVMATIQGLDALRTPPGFFLSVNCVLTPLNVREAPALLDWGQRSGVPVNFTVGEVRERFHNLGMASDVVFDDPQARAHLVEFLGRLGRQRGLLRHHALRYRELAAMIGHHRRRRLACQYALAGLVVGSDASVYYCKKSRCIGNLREKDACAVVWAAENLAYRRSELLDRECGFCFPNTFNAIEMQKDLLKLVRLLW